MNYNNINIFKQTKKICRINNIILSRSKGQNFLINEVVYDKIVKSADLKKDDEVLEVGPGLGFLTQKIARTAKKVIAVELDDRLADALKNRLREKGINNAEVVNKDIIGIRNQELGIRNNEYKVIANLPYNITSIFLRKFLSGDFKPKMMVLLLQKEVAERITAQPGEMSLLAVSVQFYAQPEIIEFVDRKNFWPEPEVDSAIIKLETRSLPVPPDWARRAGQEKKPDYEKEFFRLVKIGFSAKRKMLKNNLANGFHIAPSEAEEKLKKTGFNPKIRAQDLSVADWLKLFNA